MLFINPERREFCLGFGIPEHELAIPCHPHADPGPTMHKHQCAACGTTWKHDDLLPAVTTREEFNRAHTCPHCGLGHQTEKYYG